MGKVVVYCLSILLLLQHCQPKKSDQSTETSTASLPVEPVNIKIGFGSCSHQDKPQPMWKSVINAKPDVWVWLGDIVYGDTEDMQVLKEKYALQKSNADYQTIIQRAQVFGIWDDHDYGVNDGGKEYPKRAESQQVLLDFLDVSEDAPERSREGAYSSRYLEAGEKQIKLILLDARYFRDPLERPDGVYTPNEEGDVLGEAQWAWLEEELEENTADLTIIGSGIQVIPEEHIYEKWANFPNARKRFFDVLAETNTQDVLLISGDRHMSEVSKLQDERFPNGLYEITSSGLTNSWGLDNEEPNQWRVGEKVITINFGLFDIEFAEEQTTVKVSIIGEENAVLLEEKIVF